MFISNCGNVCDTAGGIGIEIAAETAIDNEISIGHCLGMKSGKIGKNMTIWNEIAHVIGIESDFGIALSGNEIYCGNGMNTAQNFLKMIGMNIEMILSNF